MVIKKSLSDKTFDIVNLSLLFLIITLMLLPLLHVLSASFSAPEDVYFGRVWVLPKNLSLAAYKKVFTNDQIMSGYFNTLVYTVIGVAISTVLTFCAAYPLSRKDLHRKNIIMIFFLIPMFFSGGLVPLYIIVNNLYLTDTMFGVILPGCLGIWNIIIVRTYIRTAIPWDLEEAAMIDGASGIKVFFKIILPLCKPILAVMILFYAVGYWNSFFNALIFLSNEKKYPLQMVLRNILIVNDLGNMTGGGDYNIYEQAMLSEALKYSSIIVSCAPILMIYPFLSRYFEKGLIVGGIKG